MCTFELQSEELNVSDEQIVHNNVPEMFWTLWYNYSENSKHIFASQLIVDQDSAQLMRNFINFAEEYDDTSFKQISLARQLTCSLT